MIEPQALGALSGTHELLLQLIEDLPARDCNRRFDPQLPSAGWLLGRAVYLELHLLRGLVMGDDDLAGRVRRLFDEAQFPRSELDAQLPPRDHLLNWAGEVFDQDLSMLANGTAPGPSSTAGQLAGMASGAETRPGLRTPAGRPGHAARQGGLGVIRQSANDIE